MLDKFKSLKWPNGKQDNGSQGKQTNNASAASAKPDSAKANTAKGTEQTTAESTAELSVRLSDSSPKVRAHAVGQVEALEILLPICLNDNNELVRQAANRQYAKLLPQDSASTDQLAAFYIDPAKHALLKTVTGYSPHANIRERGVALFSKDEDLADIAINTRYRDTRSSAANRIKAIEVVDKCWRKIKTSDKNAARDLKARLDSFHQQERIERDRLEQTSHLVDSMQTLSGNVWSPHYANAFSQLQTRWRGLDFTPSPQSVESYQNAEKIAQAKVAAHAEQQRVHEARIVTLEHLATLSTQLHGTTFEALPNTLQPVADQLTQQQTQWQTLNASIAADSAQESQFNSARKKLRILLDDARELLRLTQSSHTAERTAQPSPQTPSEASSSTAGQEKFSATDRHQSTAADQPQSIATADESSIQKLQALYTRHSKSDKVGATFFEPLPALIKSLQQQREQNLQADKALKDNIFKQFGALQGAIRSKRWGPAKSIHERLAKKIARYPDSKDKLSMQEKHTRAGVELQDLGDWKEFAALPKHRELCEQMEQLPAAGLSLKDQADRIKDLQVQWKKMGASPAQEELWPRFKLAADTAYEPCAKFFAAKRDEKNSKLQKRSDICDMLEKYIETSDWENPDWRLVEKTLHAAKRAWRDLRVYDRKASKPLDERFDGLLAALNGKLDPVYEANAAEKTELITRVKQLGESDINQHCINQVKSIQAIWKRGGIMRRKTDQALWKEFNEACSAIFNTHRNHQRDQYQSSIEHVTRAKSIIGELKKIATGSSIDEKQTQALQEEFHQLPEFPERDERYIKRDFNKALDSVERNRQKVADNSRNAEMTRLHHKASLCEQLEALAGSDTDTIQSKIDDLLNDWQDGEKTDNSAWKKAMNLRRDTILEHLQAGTLPDYEKNTTERRLLCIRLEILLEKDTPAEDKALRMQHQLAQLQQGMTSNAAMSKDIQLRDMRIEWLCAFAPSPEQAQPLNMRWHTTLDGHNKADNGKHGGVK